MRKWGIYYNFSSYNRMMLRPLAVIPLITLLLVGCGENIKTKAQVQQAILRRLQSTSGLDLNALDFAITSVTFNNNFAYATAVFHPKNDGNLDSGMTMTYTLQDQNGKWVVVKVGDSQGHGVHDSASGNADQLPPGHPAIGASDPNGNISDHQGASGQAQ